MSSKHERGLLGGTFVIAVLLALASAASACTVWEGKLTVWGVSPGSSGAVSAVGSGGGSYVSGMSYCSGSPSGQADVGPAGGATRQIKLSVAVEQCTGGGGDGALPGGLYLVNYLPDKSADCMNGLEMGQFMLPPSGSITEAGPFTIPGLGSDPNGGLLSTTVGGWADICIDNVGTIYGNQVPIFLL